MLIFAQRVASVAFQGTQRVLVFYISFILFLHTFFIPRHLRFWGAGPAIQSPGNHGGPRVNAEDFVASGEAAMLSW